MIRINLIRETSSPPPTSSYAGLLPMPMLGGGLIVVHLILGAWSTSLAETRDTLRLEIASEQSAALRQESGLDAIAVGDEALTGAARVGARLRSVAVAAPPDLWLVGYRELRGEVTMRGVSSTDEATRVFVESLAASPAFRRVEITETVRRASADRRRGREPGLQEFSLRAHFEDGAAPIGADGADS